MQEEILLQISVKIKERSKALGITVKRHALPEANMPNLKVLIAPGPHRHAVYCHPPER